MNNSKVHDEYQAAIDAFKEALADIDARHNTYAKLNHDDMRIRPLQVYGEQTQLIKYSREIEVEEIILE